MWLVAITEGSAFGPLDDADRDRHCAAHEGLLVIPGASQGAMSVTMETGMAS